MTKKLYIFIALVLLSSNFELIAQNEPQNTVQRMYKQDAKLTIGAYGQINYNQEINAQTNYNGNMDVHRNTLAYNQFTGSNFGSGIMGYYLELSYNVLQASRTKHELIPFVRYNVK